MADLEAVLAALPTARAAGAGQWMARCPAHDDRRASLAVSRGDDGAALVYCHAGCDYAAILGALGIDGPRRAPRRADPHAGAVYLYTDAAGAPVRRKLRHGKHLRVPFGWEHYDEAGRWARGAGTAPPVLYRLHELAARGPGARVYLVEGEKDADTVAALGLVATTRGDGAGARWRPAYTEQLAAVGAAEIIVCADADDPGTAAALATIAALREAGLAVRGPVYFGPRGSKADVADWLAADPARDAAALAAHVDAELRAAPADAAASAVVEAAAWRAALLCTPRGQVQLCAANWRVILAGDPAYAGRWAHDVRTDTQLIDGRPLEDGDVDDVAAWLEREHTDGRAIAIAQVERAVAAVCRANPVNRVWDAIAAVRWDRTPRVHDWLATYLGAASTPYTHAVGEAWLIQAVERARDPGCQADHMLVLEGEQGAGKSTALRTLAGAAWYCDDVGHVSTDGKAAAERIADAWIVEIAELAGISRAEVEAVKAWVSRRVDRYRPAYARRAVDRPRGCVFAATTNDDRYLLDDTGARRYWPVRVGRIDLPALARDRAQLWAEAIARAAAGARGYLDGAAAAAAADEAAARQIEDPWEPRIRASFVGRSEITTAEALARLGVADASRIGRREEMRMGRVLRRLGGERVRVDDSEGRRWVYRWARPLGTAAEPVAPPAPTRAPAPPSLRPAPVRDLAPWDPDADEIPF